MAYQVECPANMVPLGGGVSFSPNPTTLPLPTPGAQLVNVRRGGSYPTANGWVEVLTGNALPPPNPPPNFPELVVFTATVHVTCANFGAR